MLFLIILQFIVSALIVVLVLCQNSGSSVTSTFSSRRGDALTGRSASGFFVKITWVLLFLFFANTVLLGKLNFRSNSEVIASDLEERKWKKTLEADYKESEGTGDAFSE